MERGLYALVTTSSILEGLFENIKFPVKLVNNLLLFYVTCNNLNLHLHPSENPTIEISFLFAQKQQFLI